MQRGQRVLHTGAVDALLLEAGDDLRPAGAVCEQSVYEDDILRLQRCLGAGNSIEHGKSGRSGGGPDQCSSIHHVLQLSYAYFAVLRNGKPPRREATKSLMAQIVPVFSRVSFNSWKLAPTNAEME
jgi:hypothetical protein